jgi:drug/metabolite transporter (DMT)-like permease
VTLYLGFFLAMACAVATQLGFLYKHKGACAAPTVDIRTPVKTVKGLFGSKWFAFGWIVALGAWVLHVAAMALAPLSVVQAVLSTGVVVLAVLAERVFGFGISRRQWAGVGLTATGLVLLVLTLPHAPGSHSSFSLPAMIAFEAGLLAIGALLISGKHRVVGEHHHGIVLGAAAGLLFGVSDVAIKALTGMDGIGEVVLSPWFGTAVLASVIAFYASARGLQDGEAVPVIAATSTCANVSTIAGGILVFGDPMPGDAFGVVVQGVAFALVIVAALLVPAPVRAADAAATT